MLLVFSFSPPVNLFVLEKQTWGLELIALGMRSSSLDTGHYRSLVGCESFCLHWSLFRDLLRNVECHYLPTSVAHFLSLAVVLAE